MDLHNSIASGIATAPTRGGTVGKITGEPSVKLVSQDGLTKKNAAEILIEHLFANSDAQIPGVAYAVAYHLAETFIGGDIIDVYHFDNNSVAFTVADISGKGTRAAVHAALIKYGLRALSSHGLAPEGAIRSMDRLYLENNNFEHNDSFATVFYATIDASRRVMTYANAGHEPVVMFHMDGTYEVLAPTAPLIGVFDDQHHLFRQRVVMIAPGSLFIATTDGITEARNAEGEMFGMDRFIDVVRQNQNEPLKEVNQRVVSAAQSFSAAKIDDDIAILAARFF